MTIKTKKCPYSKYCGGCDYQGIDYFEQLKIKQEKEEKLLNRFSKVKPILGCENPYNYRNKVQVSLGYNEAHELIVGNYVPSSHIIVEVDECEICDKGANEIINSIKRLINKYKISIFDERAYRGCLRHILIRSTNTEEYMVVLVTGSSVIRNSEGFIRDIVKYNPKVKTIVQNINNKHTSMVLSDKNIILYGKGYIVDELLGLKFQVSANSFYQVNKYQTKVLYSKAIELAKLSGNETLIDAYCGTGTIGLLMAKHVKNVIGVEINSRAVKDAIKNSKNNKINNIEFICDDASNYMKKCAKNKTNIDVLVMDPPRAGADQIFLNAVSKLLPNKIIYISCNPITLKENLNYLSRYYSVDTIQPVDMFPFSEHVETVVLLSIR